MFRNPIAAVVMLGFGGLVFAALPNRGREQAVPDVRLPEAPRAAPELDAAVVPANHALRLLHQHFGIAMGTSLATQECELEALIATVPDPHESHLDWMFDQYVDALRRAHEAADYVVDRFWLPWQSMPKTGDENPARIEPGVLLFRQGNGRKLRLLFVVGEVPTSGLHQPAFERAASDLAEVTTALGKAEISELRIVGPSFSGAALSLRIALDRWIDGDQAQQRTARVITGAATSGSNQSTIARPNRITFESTIHCDDTLRECLKAHVLPQLGLEEHQVAILREGSTAYGAQLSEGANPGSSSTMQPDGYLYLPFPQNISSLRRDYATSWARELATRAKEAVGLDLDDREALGELPRAVSPLSTAVTELQLAELARTLEDRHIRMVILFATDVRDKLFLGREIADRLPDIQLLTTESNLLFVRSELASAQRGMLVLSTYPLFVTPTDWLPQSPEMPEQRLAFASDGAEGIYNATLVQLGREEAAVDYAYPDRGNDHESSADHTGGSRVSLEVLRRRPPVWLTCVGKTMMLPVAVYGSEFSDATTPGAGTTEVPDHTSASADDNHRFARLESPNYPLAITREVWPEHPNKEQPGLATLLLILVLVVLVVVSSWRLLARRGEHKQDMAGIGKQSLPDRALEYAELRKITHVQHYELYRTIRVTVLTAPLLLHATLAWFVANQERTGIAWLHFGVTLTTVLCGTAASLVGAIFTIRVAGRHFARALRFARTHTLAPQHRLARVIRVAFSGGIGRKHGVARRRGFARALEFARALKFERVASGLQALGWTCELAVRTMVSLLALAWGMATPFYAYRIATLGDMERELFFHRATVIGQCVTPLLPLFVIGIAMAAWCHWHVRRVVLLAEALPHESLTAAHVPYERRGASTQSLRDSLTLAIPDRRGLLAGVIVVAFGVWLWSQFLPTIESLVAVGTFQWFDHMLPTGMVLMVITTAWAAYRLAVVWRRFTRCLGSGSARQQVACKTLLDQHRVATSLGLWRPAHESELQPTLRLLWRRLATATTSKPQKDEDWRSIARCLADTTVPDVRRRTDLVVALERVRKPLQSADDVAGDSVTGDALAVRNWLTTVNEILALEAIAWVRWTLGHLRLLAFFLLVSLLLTTGLLWSYPFHPQSLVRIAFLILCASAVGVLTHVVAELSSHPVLAGMTSGTAGHGTWNKTLIGNVVTYSLLPMLALATSQVPGIGATLLAWLEPLLKVAMTAG